MPRAVVITLWNTEILYANVVIFFNIYEFLFHNNTYRTMCKCVRYVFLFTKINIMLASSALLSRRCAFKTRNLCLCCKLSYLKLYICMFFVLNRSRKYYVFCFSFWVLWVIKNRNCNNNIKIECLPKPFLTFVITRIMLYLATKKQLIITIITIFN